MMKTATWIWKKSAWGINYFLEVGGGDNLALLSLSRQLSKCSEHPCLLRYTAITRGGWVLLEKKLIFSEEIFEQLFATWLLLNN